MMRRRNYMKVLFASSEASPFVKVGGLADVIGSLPVALKDKGIEAAVIVPKHRAVSGDLEFCGSTYIKMGWRNQYAGLFKCVHEGVTFWFVDNEYYFGGESVYGYNEGEAEKYAFFALAVIELLPLMEGYPDIIHCNDWQTGLIPLLLKTRYVKKNIRTVFTVHNLKYQGIYGFQLLKDLLDIPDSLFTSEFLEFYGGVSFLKAGLIFADKITTVSPTYREEVLTPYFGERMDGVLNTRTDDFTGILNGIGNEYDPKTDIRIQYNYSVENTRNKSRCKASLQAELELARDAHAPIVAIVSRLYDQKGIDLIKCMIHELMFSTNMQLVVLGTGERGYEEFFASMVQVYPGRTAVRLCYDGTLAQRIYAGADILLMPSRFEPCGLAQLIAMKYGTVPVVRATGGLKDTVVDIENGGWGFRFDNYNAHDMADTLKRAIDLYSNKNKWNVIRKRAMSADFSWSESADKYAEVYEGLRS